MKEQSNETQQEGKLLTNATTVNKFNKSISDCRVHNYAMGIVVVNTTDRSLDDNARNSELQKEKNPSLGKEKVRVVQQVENGKGGDLKTYHRYYPKISSNFDKRTPILIIHILNSYIPKPVEDRSSEVQTTKKERTVF